MSSAGSFRVELCKECLIFSAAHFITFAGNICERLHGHNYRVKCTVENELDENRYVIDFIALRDTLQKISSELDHHVLLPESHPLISVSREGAEVVARFEGKRWIFPSEDCVILPVINTTAEELARYIANELVKRWKAQGIPIPMRIELGVDENEGQWGVFSQNLR